MRVLWGSWETMGPFSALGGLSLSDQGPRELGSDQSSSKPVASESIVTLGQRKKLKAHVAEGKQRQEPSTGPFGLGTNLIDLPWI